MSITKSIGKNTLGGGQKMAVDLKTYNRSTHNLSYAWRSTMGVGTLVPCMKILALPGDTFDINIDKKVLTHPTVGPLFGSYKMQVDIFQCPIRLYQAMLHNNMLGVGLNMEQVKLPQLVCSTTASDDPTDNNKWSQIHPSSILAYLGLRGWGHSKGSSVEWMYNAVPTLGYLDIFKNYYANTQEENFFALFPTGVNSIRVESELTFDNRGIRVTGGDIKIYTTQEKLPNLEFIFEYSRNQFRNTYTYQDLIDAGFELTTGGTYQTLTYSNDYKPIYGSPVDCYEKNGLGMRTIKLEELDELREKILGAGSTQFKINTETNTYFKYLLGRDSDNVLNTKWANSGLILKTHQSDIFNNWINTEWIDGENGISAITSIDTSSGEFTIDTLNLARKVYDMLNRIAVSGGTYKDWVETVYTNEYGMHAETPIYEGGMSCEIEFQEVVSYSANEAQPLGTLAGRGYSSESKGGKLHIKVTEPSYIIGIASITPRVDYSQGTEWDTMLKTMDDLHKPQLDGIGYQDLNTKKMAWWKDISESIGKQPAWLDYMTNFNKVYGNFAIEDNEAFMVLNRIYEPENGDYKNGKLNYTTYINPEDYIYQFAERSLEAQDFWVQLGFGIEARRVMSAKQIPNL